MICGIVLPNRVFVNQGCPNCESLVSFRTDDQLVQDCTSSSFEGLVSIASGKDSWVARWLRVDKFVPGLYAVKVNGKIPPEIIGDLEDKGVIYRPRDGSVQD